MRSNVTTRVIFFSFLLNKFVSQFGIKNEPAGIFHGIICFFIKIILNK